MQNVPTGPANVNVNMSDVTVSRKAFSAFLSFACVSLTLRKEVSGENAVGESVKSEESGKVGCVCHLPSTRQCPSAGVNRCALFGGLPPFFDCRLNRVYFIVF